MSGKLRDHILSIAVAIVIALLVRSFLLTGYKVPTSAMAPTLVPGDFIFSLRLPYVFGNYPIERGDVVVFTYPDKPKTFYVKRLVGLPGDVIRLSKGQLSINDEPMKYQVVQEQNWFETVVEKTPSGDREILRAKAPTASEFGPMVVPPNHAFMLGDNRDSSDDSRYWGTVPIERVEGKVLVIWLSLNWTRKAGIVSWPQVRWERLFKRVR